VLDIDAAPTRTDETFQHVSSREHEGAARIARRVLDDHPEIVHALREILRRGHCVVVLPGNHDAQLVFPTVQRTVQDVLPGTVFRSWFHRTRDGIHVEHGHLYDPLCTLSDPIVGPRRTGRLEDTVGSIATYYGPGVFGELNPYASDMRASNLGTLQRTRLTSSHAANLCRGLRELLLVQEARRRPDLEIVPLVSTETGVDAGQIQKHAQLWAKKANAKEIEKSDDRAQLRSAMSALDEIYPVRAIVMGHTHEAFVDKAKEGSVLANSGTWSPSIGLDASRPIGTFVWTTCGRAGFDLGVYALNTDETITRLKPLERDEGGARLEEPETRGTPA
jgi:UDP-2,3-diacylglucosamine pyrophosphatase LpxH